MTIAPATGDQIEQVRALFREYRDAAEAEVCFASYDRELAQLPEGYDVILLALDPEPFGCVALRPMADGDCEMKRLYVRPSHQGLGVGRKLVEALMEEARARGYRRMMLDTLWTMTAAIALYRSLGFQPTGRYNDTPDPRVLFFERLLG